MASTMTATSLISLSGDAMGQTDSASDTGVSTRLLGNTGQRVSMVGLGGAHAGGIKDDKECIRLMHSALDEGITFFDNAWEYNGGRSEEMMGKALAMDGRRSKVFLMTKACERDYAGAMRNLEESLKRLQTDYLDLWQFHEIDCDNDPEWVFEKGAAKAALDARKQGKIRFIGFTGHKDPQLHLEMLKRPFHWDTAQMPINVLDAHYRSFQRQVVPLCIDRNIGVIGMKGLAGGWPTATIPTKTGVSAEDCIRYCLSLPISTQVVGLSSLDELKALLSVARRFEPMSTEEKQMLLSKVKDAAGDGRFELFKSSKAYDSQFHRQQHGFDKDIHS